MSEPSPPPASSAQTAAGAGRLGAIVLDCAEPRALAEFLAPVLGTEIVSADDRWVDLAVADGAPRVSFQRVARYRPPSRLRPQQLHLDVSVDDLDRAESVVLGLGAEVRGDIHPAAGFPWRVYADPAGHPFCLCSC
jgi:hypothetical protein